MALNNVIHRRLRSWLTVLGIVIGVAAVVSLVSLGQGFEATILGELEGFGPEMISIVPGPPTASGDPERNPFDAPSGEISFSQAEVRIVDAHPGVRVVDGVVSGRSEVTFRGETKFMNLKGVDPSAWMQMEDRDVTSGRLLVGGDARSAVITTAMVDHYKFPIQVNQVINVDGQNLRVVGIIDGSGFFGVEDRSVYTTKDTARGILGMPSDRVSEIEARAASGVNVGDVAQDLKRQLLAHRHLSEDDQDFTIFTGEEIQRQVAEIMGAFTAFLAGIAAIALLVGGIGIANTMFMAVMERSRQIGILKALGVSDRGVASIFLAESSLLGLVGGTLGVALGWIAALLFSRYSVLALGPPGTQPPTLVVGPELVIGGILFSVILGSIFGLMPALRAARLVPVESLRA